MLRMKPAETASPAPLGREERLAAISDTLRPVGIFARRTGHAASAGITITYYHLSEAANGKRAVALLAEALDWQETDIAEVGGTIAVTTRLG